MQPTQTMIDQFVAAIDFEQKLRCRHRARQNIWRRLSETLEERFQPSLKEFDTECALERRDLWAGAYSGSRALKWRQK